MSLQTQTTQTKTESEEMEMKIKEEFGFYIRKTVIKNLLSAHRKIAGMAVPCIYSIGDKQKESNPATEVTTAIKE